MDKCFAVYGFRTIYFDGDLVGTGSSYSNFEGSTALHYAVLGDQKEMVEVLMEAGADPNVKNKMGHLPRDYARGEELRTILDAYVEDVC